MSSRRLWLCWPTSWVIACMLVKWTLWCGCAGASEHNFNSVLTNSLDEQQEVVAALAHELGKRMHACEMATVVWLCWRLTVNVNQRWPLSALHWSKTPQDARIRHAMSRLWCLSEPRFHGHFVAASPTMLETPASASTWLTFCA